MSYISVILKLSEVYPQKGSKGKKGKGKALVPPVVEPVYAEPAQEEVDKTTNVKPKNSC